MTDYILGGPPRYAHQRRGLQKMIDTGGVAALLYDPGLGKRLSVESRVETPQGTRRFGDLEVGDRVLGRKGTPVEVQGIYDQGTGPAYRVIFSDGAEVICDSEHLWTVADHYQWNQGKWRTVTLGDLLRLGVKKNRPERRDSANVKWFVPWCEPLEYAERSLKVDPYALGALLANGHLQTCYMTTNDSEIVQRMVESTGLPWLERTSRGSTARRWAFPELRAGVEFYGLRDCLSRDKFIPEDYLQGSVDQRKSLLAGLMDCDGSITPGKRAFYHTRSHSLAKDVTRLVRSLGGLARIQPHVRRDEVDYNVQIWTPFNPFLLPRKALNYFPKPWRRGISRVEPVEPTEMRCIKVDAPDGLFVVESGVVTHNTGTLLDYAGLLALKVRSGEARILVVCPLAAVDTWVIQSETFVSPQVRFWAEALGGSITQRGEALAARGGNPFTRKGASIDSKSAIRALHHRRALAWAVRGPEDRVRPITPSEGPDALGEGPGRLIIEVVNIDAFASRAKPKYGSGTQADFMLEAVKRYAPDLVVVDEAHKIKSATANASRLLGRIGAVVPRRVALTGTVMPHSPLDIFGIWRFLDPYAFGPVLPDGSRKISTWSQFRSRYAVMGGWMGKEVVSYTNLDEMREIMAKNAIVAKKEEALDLPETTDVIVPVNLSPAERRAYQDLKDQLVTQLTSGSTVTVANRLTQMLRLRQITSGHLPDDNGVQNVIGRSKADVIKSIVQDTLTAEKRIVIFCLFSQEIAVLRKVLAREGTEIMVIEGGTPTAERRAMRERFGSDDPARIVMIAQIKTMSLAVNELVSANHAIFASLSQQRDDLIQARDRLNRIGQTRPVTFWYAIALGTVDQVILDSHQQRTDLETAMLKHIKSGE